MTRQKFVAAQKAMSRSTRRWLIGVLVASIVVFFVSSLLLSDDARHQRWFEIWLLMVGGHPITYGIICAVVVAWFVNDQPKRFGVSCPNCGTPLVRASADDVIATGRCAERGERIVDEEMGAGVKS